MAVVLTQKQQITLDRLNKNDFQPIKQADITRLLGKMLDTKVTAEQVVPKVIEYEKVKFPSKSVDEIQKYLTKKIKQKDDRAMFREVLSQGDYSSFPDVSKDKAKQSKETYEEKLPMDGSMTKKTPSNGSSDDLEKLLDKLLGGDDTDNKQASDEPFTGEGRKIEEDTSESKPNENSIDFSNFFKEGSKAYKENKTIIDKVKKSLTKEKLNNGSWFTSIASLEVPELEILQKVVDMTPLGFSIDDKDKLGKMLSRDPDKMKSVSTSESLKLVAKMLVNPDQIGNLVKTRTEQMSGDAVEAVQKFYRKITGQKESKDEELGSLEDIINSRRSKIDKDKKRQADLDRLMGKETKEETEKSNLPQTTAGGGVVYPTINNIPTIDIQTGKISGDKSDLSAEEILKPPTIPGFDNSTWYEDVFGFLKGVFVPDVSTGNDKEKYLNKLKESDPTAYNKYQEAMRKYEYTKKKLSLSKDSDIDLSIHKDQVLKAFNFSRKLLEKASSLKELTSDQIETVYDVSGTLDDVLSGNTKISYDDLNKIQRAVFNIIPKNVLADSDIDTFMKNQIEAFGAGFEGDSKLADSFDYINDLLTETGTDDKSPDIDKPEDDPDEDKQSDDYPDEEKYPDNDIKEKSLDTSSSKEDGQNWSTLRPRMNWGGTDEMFFRENKEVQQANLISEAMSIESAGWGNGADNTLYKMNQVQDKMRYGNTFAMPRPPIQDPLELPSKFVQMNQPIMISQYAPTGQTFNNVGRDPYLFGHYQQFNPSYQKTVYPVVEQTNVQHYPYVADFNTGGEIQSVMKFDYLTNLRFTS